VWTLVVHDNKVHQNACNIAEMNRQVAVQAAGGSQAAIRTAEAAYYRAVIASCVTNGVEAAVFRQALYDVSGQHT
jgi:hypothetical protein